MLKCATRRDVTRAYVEEWKHEGGHMMTTIICCGGHGGVILELPHCNPYRLHLLRLGTTANKQHLDALIQIAEKAVLSADAHAVESAIACLPNRRCFSLSTKKESTARKEHRQGHERIHVEFPSERFEEAGRDTTDCHTEAFREDLTTRKKVYSLSGGFSLERRSVRWRGWKRRLSERCASRAVASLAAALSGRPMKFKRK